MTELNGVAAACLVALLAILIAGDNSFAQESESSPRDKQQTRQAQAVSKAVYDKILAVQELASQEKYQEALDVLATLIRKGRLTDYEHSQVMQNVGHIHYSAGRVRAAIAAFEELLRIADLEEQLRMTTLYMLAQLHTSEGDHEDALRYLDDWFRLESNPASEPFVLRAQNLYQVGRYSSMITAIESATQIAAQRGKPVREDWYVLLSFGYFQQENFEKVRDIHKTLLENWPSKRYWISLAGAYAELGEESNLAAAYDVVNTQEMLEKESELVMMAQLYLLQEVPYKAAQLIEAAIDDGRVSPTEKSYRLLSQAWYLAREDEKSIPALQKAAQLSDDGTLDLRLGNAYLNLERYAECINTIKNGLQKGGLKNPDHAYISLGMCHFNQQEYSAAIKAFQQAAKTPASGKTARQWIKVIRSEIARDEEIVKAESKAREKLQLLEERRAASRRIGRIGDILDLTY